MITKNIGKDSGLDYDLNVKVEDGLLTCDECDRLCGYYTHRSEAEQAARRHLSAKHQMLLVDV